MASWIDNERRRVVATTRKPPNTPRQLAFAALGDGKLGDEEPSPPAEVLIEPTEPTGEVAYWLDDIWWLELLQRWAERSLTVHVLPSPAALLHPVVLHHLGMLKRVAPRWRLIGHGRCADFNGNGDIETLATSAYDEVRILAESGTGDSTGSKHAVRIEDLFRQVLQVQRAAGVLRPILVRATTVPASPHACPTGSPKEATAPAREA